MPDVSEVAFLTNMSVARADCCAELVLRRGFRNAITSIGGSVAVLEFWPAARRASAKRSDPRDSCWVVAVAVLLLAAALLAMLFADKRALETNLKVSLLAIREKELNFYVRCGRTTPSSHCRIYLPNPRSPARLRRARRRRIASRSAHSRRCSLASPTPASRR